MATAGCKPSSIQADGNRELPKMEGGRGGGGGRGRGRGGGRGGGRGAGVSRSVLRDQALFGLFGRGGELALHSSRCTGDPWVAATRTSDASKSSPRTSPSFVQQRPHSVTSRHMLVPQAGQLGERGTAAVCASIRRLIVSLPIRAASLSIKRGFVSPNELPIASSPLAQRPPRVTSPLGLLTSGVTRAASSACPSAAASARSCSSSRS